MAAAVGMGEDEIYGSTPRHIMARVRGANDRDKRQHERLWEIARFIAFYSVVPHDSKNKIKRPTDLLAFPWDAPRIDEWVPIPEMDAEEEQRLNDWIKTKYPGAIEIPAI